MEITLVKSRSKLKSETSAICSTDADLYTITSDIRNTHHTLGNIIFHVLRAELNLEPRR